MRYMYTNKPTEGCHYFGGSVYGKPVFPNFQERLLIQGWVFDVSKLPETEKVKETEEAPLSRDERAESLGIPLHDANGKKRHWKLIQGDIEAHDDEHNEG